MSSLPTHSDPAASEKPADPLLSLDDHAAFLRANGLGPPSIMIHESFIGTRLTHADMPALHRAEGGRFAEMAYTVAPPPLVAKFLGEECLPIPPIMLLTHKDLQSVFQKILTLTNLRGIPEKPGIIDPRHSPQTARDYFAHCVRDPNVFLACQYLSFALQYFVLDLNNRMGQPENDLIMMAFSSHFSATNIVTALPLALTGSLHKIQGGDSDFTGLDPEVVRDALDTLHSSGRFLKQRRALTDTASITEPPLQCPMERYVFELVGKFHALGFLAKGIQMTEWLKRPDVQVPTPIRHHFENRELVSRCAASCLRALELHL